MSHTATEDWVAIAVTCEGSGTWETGERSVHEGPAVKPDDSGCSYPGCERCIAAVTFHILSFSASPFSSGLFLFVSSCKTNRRVSECCCRRRETTFDFSICRLLTFQPLRQVACICKIKHSDMELCKHFHMTHTRYTRFLVLFKIKQFNVK